MARLTRKGTKLDVFSGKKADLSRVLLQTLENTSPLIAYDVWRKTRKVKGFLHVNSKTAYRRLEALERGGWVVEKGTRLGKRFFKVSKNS